MPQKAGRHIILGIGWTYVVFAALLLAYTSLRLLKVIRSPSDSLALLVAIAVLTLMVGREAVVLGRELGNHGQAIENISLRLGPIEKRLADLERVIGAKA